MIVNAIMTEVLSNAQEKKIYGICDFGMDLASAVKESRITCLVRKRIFDRSIDSKILIVHAYHDWPEDEDV